MLLYRLGPEGFHAVAENETGELRLLHCDPLSTRPGGFELGRAVDRETAVFLAPVAPSKIVCVGRNYRAHAEELGNPMPTEPMLFLKPPSSMIGPNAPVILPPESAQVDYEGEIAVVVRDRIYRASRETVRTAILGVTCACDVSARDLQKRDVQFTRGKGFDTFCPLGPAIRLDADPEDVTVVTRLNGAERQRGHTREMAFGLIDLLVYISRIMTLEPGDVVLTGTPAGVGRLADGDVLEVEIPGVGVLRNPVEARAAEVSAEDDG
ncbi:MAG: fumarylacetoacetate hydrolase family protein [Acidobacteriota bacterium]